MKELIEVLEDCHNVKTITYDLAKKIWIVTYVIGDPDEIDTECLIDFLKNG